MSTRGGKIWIIIAFLGGLFTMLDSGHQLYDDHKQKKLQKDSEKGEDQ